MQSTILSIIITLIAINIIVTVHEFGHYITAKKFGVGIKEFSIGMGPVIYQRQKKKNRFVFFRKKKQFPEEEFKFSIRVLPIGGFVSLKGEGEESNDDDSFSKLKPHKRLVVLLAGAFMNIILGLVCTTIIGTFFVNCDITTKVSSFIPTQTESNMALSEESGLKIGDEIYKINGHRTRDVTDIQYELGLANSETTDVVVKRDGKLVTIEDVRFPITESQGLKVMNMDFKVVGEEKTFVGTLKYIGNSFIANIKTVYRSLGGLITGKIPLKSMSGIVGVTATVSETIENTAMSFSDFIYFTLSLMFLLTINIGLFNVLPIPALDGGQSCACVFEMITKKKINEKVYNTITTVFFVLLLIFMAVVTIKDIFNLF